MIIRCYGARGSIPVSGPEYLRYGGDTTCWEIRSRDDDIMIIDAGSGIRRLGNSLLQENRFDYTLFLTHSHWDHILGFPFFKPIYEARTRIAVRGCNEAQGDLRKLLARAMTGPYFPVNFDSLAATITFEDDCVLSYRVGPIDVWPIHLSHPNGGQGYKLVEDGKTFVFLTDNELGYRHRGGLTAEAYVEFARDADVLIHDAEYTPAEYQRTRTWGHSTYLDALEVALQARVRCFGLYHHNQDRDDAGVDQILAHCREIVASQGAALEVIAVFQGMAIVL
ncbi:MAG: MBL fold metallo-hydrolase [Desulfobacca sp.]|uniref:MBL fold metallo-hydrolase n=1 Tax=Desulfobacca sp. TaxID=2067990 RepID=UPI004049C820